MPNSRRRKWSPGEITAMRAELDGGASLEEVGKKRGVTRQRVSQLVGNINRPSTWKSQAQGRQSATKVRLLLKTGLSDEQIVSQTDLSLGTVRKHRLNAGVHRPNPLKKWTPESIIEFAQWWHQRFGSLASTDWFPQRARKLGHTERVNRFYELGAPHIHSVQRYFGTWLEMKRQAGLPASPRGAAAHGHWKKGPA